MPITSLILISAILIGQLVKIPFLQGGLTILDVVSLGLVIYGLLKIKFTLKNSPLFVKTGLIFLTLASISLIITPLSLTFNQYLISFSYTARIAIFLLLGWLIYLKIFPDLLDKIPSIFFYSGLGLAILGLLQFIFIPDLRFLQNDLWDPHYFRTASTFLDPNFLGSFLVLSLLVTFTSFAKLKPQIYWASLLIIFLSILTTFSRGSYLAFIITFLTLATLKKSIKLAVFTLILFGSLLLGFNIYQQLVALPRGIDKTQSAQFRLNTWQQGLTIFQNHPVFGVGFNAYKFALKQYHLADDQFLISRGSTSNDSSFLHIASTIGILGLMSYLVFLGSLLLTGWEVKQNPSGQSLISGTLGAVTQSFFINNLFYPFILLGVVLLATKCQASIVQKK